MSSQPEEQDKPAEAVEAHVSQVWFRKTFLVQEMCLRPEETVAFDGIGESAVSVLFTSFPGAERQRWSRSPSLRCVVTVRAALSRRSRVLFAALWEGKHPEGIDAADLLLNGTGYTGPTDPVFREGRVPALLLDAVAPIELELEKNASRVVGLVRWRCNRTGPIELPALSPLEWSIDGGLWKLDPRRPNWPTAAFGPDLVISDARRLEIESRLATGEQEPVHQSLLREAESLLGTNPRSALAIGATATEVAVKTLVSQLAPETSWLMQNLPSPPIAKIIEEYLPILLPSAPRFAPDLVKRLKAAVTLRNELVHGSRTTIEAIKVAAAFQTFRDIAWLCDHFSGVPWAVNRVSKSTRDAMHLTATVDTNSWFVD
jgi:hypothetical protein